MRTSALDGRARLLAAFGAGALQAGLLFMLLNGFNVVQAPSQADGLKLFDAITAPPPPPVPESLKPERKPAPSPEPEGAASAPNIVSRATEIVVPPPRVPLPVPPVVVTAPKADTGAEATSGNAPVRGPGTGAGGAGEGFGSGGAGSGRGGGGGKPLRFKSGRITDRDYPAAAFEVGAQGTVYLRFTVGVKGRVTDCTVTRSSGNRDLDTGTCKLIMERFRYEPSRDAQGRPYPDVVTGKHLWELWDLPPDS